MSQILILFIFLPESLSQSCPAYKSNAEILGLNKECDIATGFNCKKSILTPTYQSIFGHVICKMQYMCIILEESEIMKKFNLSHTRVKELELKDKTCKADHIAKSVIEMVSQDDQDHLMFCSRKVCDSTPDDDGILVTHSHFDCGTETKINATHLIYENMVFSPRSSSSPVVLLSDPNSLDFKLPFICSWELEKWESQGFNWAVDSIVKRLIMEPAQGVGEFIVRLQLYKTNAFKNPFTAPPILKTNAPLFIGADVHKTGYNISNLYPTIVHLWITNTADPYT